jgi:hypothetical protein
VSDFEVSTDERPNAEASLGAKERRQAAALHAARIRIPDNIWRRIFISLSLNAKTHPQKPRMGYPKLQKRKTRG